jgi:hypothetical protein
LGDGVERERGFRIGEVRPAIGERRCQMAFVEQTKLRIAARNDSTVDGK